MSTEDLPYKSLAEKIEKCKELYGVDIRLKHFPELCDPKNNNQLYGWTALKTWDDDWHIQRTARWYLSHGHEIYEPLPKKLSEELPIVFSIVKGTAEEVSLSMKADIIAAMNTRNIPIDGEVEIFHDKFEDQDGKDYFEFSIRANYTRLENEQELDQRLSRLYKAQWMFHLIDKVFDERIAEIQIKQAESERIAKVRAEIMEDAKRRMKEAEEGILQEAKQKIEEVKKG